MSYQDFGHLDLLQQLCDKDIEVLNQKEREYASSWAKRGGIGLYMMLARKWDRLEAAVEKHGYDLFKAIEADQRDEGILDDLRDLRRYLLLGDAWLEYQKRPIIRGNTFETDRRVPRIDLSDHPIDLKNDPTPQRKDPTGMEHPFGFDEKEDA